MQKQVLFPGYVFVCTKQPDQVEKRLQIFTHGVKPVRIGGGFNPIRSEEQEFLQSMMNEDYEIGYSSGNIIDGKLVIDYGPLMDKTESVVKIDRHRRFAEILMTLWGVEQRIRVGLGVISKS